MKKIYAFLFAAGIAYSTSAQTFSNAGMENWRNTTSGGILGGPTDNIHAPTSWYGLDSLIIADGETYGHLAGAGNNWNAQIFEESTIVHGGSHSAKLITLQQDILGNVGAVLSNSIIAVNVPTLLSGGSMASAISYSGGTAVTGRIASVTAWVKYKAGVDSLGMPGLDTGSMTVTVYSKVYTDTDSTTFVDSVVGTATFNILPDTAWTQITAHIIYTDSVNGADTVRIRFASSSLTSAMDSSTLYVDDVSMAYIIPNGVKNVNLQNDVKVYPNPSSGMVYIERLGNKVANFRLYAMNGQQVLARTITGNGAIDISNVPDGLYFYSISDMGGNSMQRGKLSVVR